MLETFAELHTQPIDTVDFCLKLKDRRHFYTVEMLSTIVDCFEKERIPMSEILDAFVSIAHQKSSDKARCWNQCVTFLEKAVEAAKKAEGDRA